VLWLLAGVYSVGYLSGDQHRHRYFFWFLLTMTGNLGLILSLDMASFYMFFALMSFSAYPLIIHRGDQAARRAGRIYMVLVVIGEAALLVAMLYSAVVRDSLLLDQGAAKMATDPAAFLIVGLLLIGFGVKAGLVPLHVWLPLAHPAAPTPASAVLSGAMIKAGLLGWLRFLPLGEVSLPDWGNLCLSIGLLMTFYGVVVGVMQREAKTVLAYSSISQMGLMTLGIGGGLLMHTAWPLILSAVLIFARHHGLSKGCLFLSVGVAPSAGGTTISKRLLQVGLIVPALVLIGAPLSMGAISKSMLKDSLKVLPDQWPLLLDVLLPLASVGTTLLMARFLCLIWPNAAVEPNSSPADIEHASLIPPKTPTTLTMQWAWAASLLLVLGAPWLIATEMIPRASLSLVQESVAWVNLWPLVIGSLVAWMAWWLSRIARSRTIFSIPAGDIIGFWPATRRFVLALIVPLSFHASRITSSTVSSMRDAAERASFDRTLRIVESALSRWPATTQPSRCCQRR
jgi:formate hydrogenlyase subunit 3/multisubunit Na+/H+ antiporter MnhD subunit